MPYVGGVRHTREPELLGGQGFNKRLKVLKSLVAIRAGHRVGSALLVSSRSEKRISRRGEMHHRLMNLGAPQGPTD